MLTITQTVGGDGLPVITNNYILDYRNVGSLDTVYDVQISCKEDGAPQYTSGFINLGGIPCRISSDIQCDKAVWDHLRFEMKAGNLMANPTWQSLTMLQKDYRLIDYQTNVEPLRVFSAQHDVVITYRSNEQVALVVEKPIPEIFEFFGQNIDEDSEKDLPIINSYPSRIIIETTNPNGVVADSILSEEIPVTFMATSNPEKGIWRFQLDTDTPAVWNILPIKTLFLDDQYTPEELAELNG